MAGAPEFFTKVACDGLRGVTGLAALINYFRHGVGIFTEATLTV
jgi:hypothetical protein